MHTGEGWRLGHRPALDGVRGIAIALVVLGHGDVPGFRALGGRVGVTLFFVLSGFLITALLLEEQARGRINLRRFYVRRVRRLGPAFLLCLGAACAFIGSGFVTVRDVLLSVSYVGNWYAALLDEPKPAPLGGLSGTWSLAVEEQFYLLWPVALIFVVGRWGVRGLGWFAAVGVTLSLVERVWLYESGASGFRIYYGTDTNAAPLLAGALVAVLLHRAVTWGRPIVQLVIVALGGLLAVSAIGGVWAWMMFPALAAAVLLIWGVARGPVPGPAWLSWPALRWLGRRSYAVYLWNCLIATAVYFVPMSWPIRVVVITLPALLLSELSWRCVEAPVLRRRSAVDDLHAPIAGTKQGSSLGDTESVEQVGVVIGGPADQAGAVGERDTLPDAGAIRTVVHTEASQQDP